MRGNSHHEFQRYPGADFERLNDFQRVFSEHGRERECVFREHGRQQRLVFRRLLIQFWDIFDGASRIPDNIS